jgi:hypothetical protein
MGGPQRWSGRYGDGKYLLPLPGIEPRIHACPSGNLAAVPTKLSAQIWVSESASSLEFLTQGESPVTNGTGGWVGLGPGLGAVENIVLPGIEPQISVV